MYSIEILLIKLKIEAGESIGVCLFSEQIKEKFGLESMFTEAYADDLTILFKWDRIGLNCVLKILRDFSWVSGLEINEKNATDDNRGRGCPGRVHNRRNYNSRQRFVVRDKN